MSGRTRPRGPLRWLLTFVKEIAVVVVGALIVSAVVRAFVGQAFEIPSGSMERTLGIGDRVVVEKLSDVKRGEVVVFADPGGWLPPTTHHERGPVGRALEFVGLLPDTGTDHLTKRIIGLPGDQVVCCDSRGRITVNEHPLNEDAYLYAAPDGRQDRPSDIRFSVVVPAGRVFVLGDHRSNSRDSRCHLDDRRPGQPRGDNAFVPINLVVGRAVAIYWPLSHLDTLKIPSTFADVPAGQTPAPSRASVQAGPDADC
ncbi:signal peptidase I [Friedmanniella endophytica]|uniref:Signal peptidase I n=1 Tax=Microlunatus kandeliicorticis TaxID=1759536 RepID=A0A7W3IUV9_9ACTN|nr:signal peptidase I [Microlunatus kandeliicorticis]MBA8795692.1 signal peptidase I [Microlunatus kandeliicorticis]